MDGKKFTEIMDEFYDNNNLLEMCQGYALSEAPSMQSLAESLYLIKLKYESIYMKLAAINKVE